jgi:hypothetical protein
VIQAELGDPALYEDKGRLLQLLKRHDAAKDHAAELMAEWEAATLRLEAAEAEAAEA